MRIPSGPTVISSPLGRPAIRRRKSLLAFATFLVVSLFTSLLPAAEPPSGFGNVSFNPSAMETEVTEVLNVLKLVQANGASNGARMAKDRAFAVLKIRLKDGGRVYAIAASGTEGLKPNEAEAISEGLSQLYPKRKYIILTGIGDGGKGRCAYGNGLSHVAKLLNQTKGKLVGLYEFWWGGKDGAPNPYPFAGKPGYAMASCSTCIKEIIWVRLFSDDGFVT